RPEVSISRRWTTRGPMAAGNMALILDTTQSALSGPLPGTESMPGGFSTTTKRLVAVRMGMVRAEGMVSGGTADSGGAGVGIVRSRLSPRPRAVRLTRAARGRYEITDHAAPCH